MSEEEHILPTEEVLPVVPESTAIPTKSKFGMLYQPIPPLPAEGAVVHGVDPTTGIKTYGMYIGEFRNTFSYGYCLDCVDLSDNRGSWTDDRGRSMEYPRLHVMLAIEGAEFITDINLLPEDFKYHVDNEKEKPKNIKEAYQKEYARYKHYFERSNTKK